jgi:UPF0042 nucleotide-binding protein
MAKKNQQTPPIIVSGLSGAGMSSVLKTLEDLGFEVFDNFPLSLVDALITDTKKSGKPMAIGIDVRSRGFKPATLLKTVDRHEAQLLFMTCDESVLRKRYTETRRKHPLAKNKPVKAGIAEETTLLAPVQAAADLVIDTSELSIHDLKHILKGHFKIEDKSLLHITVQSFGFRHGVPRSADIVMDVRFLKNPHWVPKLKPKTGKDENVGAYIQTDEGYEAFIEGFKGLLGTVLPRYAKEGKSYLTIAVGCTGGKHRSVFVVEQLKPWLKASGYDAYIEHRDLDKN